MSALALTTSQAQATSIDFTRYVTIDEACRLLQVSDRHLRRLCTHELERSGMALFVRPEAGGKACWHISRSYNLKLAPGAAGSVQQMPALDGYTQQQRDQALRRMACVMAFREARMTWRGSQQQWLGQLVESLQKKYPDVSVSQRTLLRWYSLFQTPSDLEKLIDRRGGNTRGGADPAAWKFFREIFLEERAPSKESCWMRTRDAARHNNWQWISLSALKRQLDQHVPPALAAKHRDPQLYRSKFATFIAQDPEGWEANQCWIGDHVTLDLWCQADGRVFRPSLTTWQDWRTRKKCGWVLSEKPNSSTILAAYDRGIEDESNMGGPAAVWIDNGKDFCAYALHGKTKADRIKERKIKIDDAMDPVVGAGLFQLLGVEAHFSIAENPNGKARLEGWHRVLHDQFDRTFITYCGRSPDNRPEGLEDILKNKRHLIPTFEHVEARLCEYMAGCNMNTEHQIKDLQGMSPDQAMAAWCKVRRVMADPNSRKLCKLQWHKPVTMHAKVGITINIAGMRLSFGMMDPALMRFKGTGELLNVAYDPNNVTEISVYDKNWAFISIAERNPEAGFHDGSAQSRKHISAVMKTKNEYERALETVAKHRHVEYLSNAELLAQEAAPKPPAPSDGQTLKIVRTPIDNQSNKAVQRKAVGHQSDSDSMPAMPRISEWAKSIEHVSQISDETNFSPLNFTNQSSAEESHEQEAPPTISGWADLIGSNE